MHGAKPAAGFSVVHVARERRERIFSLTCSAWCLPPASGRLARGVASSRLARGVASSRLARGVASGRLARGVASSRLARGVAPSRLARWCRSRGRRFARSADSTPAKRSRHGFIEVKKGWLPTGERRRPDPTPSGPYPHTLVIQTPPPAAGYQSLGGGGGRALRPCRGQRLLVAHLLTPGPRV